MAVVTKEEIQHWLEVTKLDIEADYDLGDLAKQAEILLFSKLATKFDTSSWIDAASTPELVRTMVAMLTASFEYHKAYSETSDAGNPYAIELRNLVLGTPPDHEDGILAGLLNGSVTLVDAPGESPADLGTISFLPDDNTEPVATFTMGVRF